MSIFMYLFVEGINKCGVQADVLDYNLPEYFDFLPLIIAAEKKTLGTIYMCNLW